MKIILFTALSTEMKQGIAYLFKAITLVKDVN